MDVEELETVGIIAFDGATKNGLQLHPDRKHLIYSMGNKVAIKNIDTGDQTFLSGHSDVISAVCVSPCGKYLASGQVTHLGFKATVIVWDYAEKRKKSSHEIHKVRIQDLCFTCDSNYLVSLGGKDDGNIVVFDVEREEAICGSSASNETAGRALTIARTNKRDRCFLTGGDRTIKVWRIEPRTRKVYGVNVKVGKIRRTVNCIVIDARDEVAFCGTTSGDIIKTRLNFHRDTEYLEPVQTPVMVACYSKIPKNPKKLKEGEGDLYSGGVTSLLLLNNEKIIVGAGDGSVEVVGITDIPLNFSAKSLKLPSTPQIRTYKTGNARSCIISMALDYDSIFVGTLGSEIYRITLSNFDIRLFMTCHNDAIYDITFPHNYSAIFATASKNDIRLWHLESQRELLRITVPNMVCTSLCFSYNGKMIFSAWNDGTVRAFKPQSGQLIFLIHNAHIKAVSAICINMEGKKLITGGCDGQIRIWKLSSDVQSLMYALKEHRGSVTSLHMSWNDIEVLSSSTDGTCIVWDIVNGVRKQVLMGTTMYMSARYSPNGLEIITCGADRKISYWESVDGSRIREIEGSENGPLNCLDISSDGRHIVTGSNDCIIKIWDYESADTSHVGLGHAAIVTACKFTPDSKHLVTVSADGAIIIWKCPFEPKFPSPPESSRTRSTCSYREEDWNKLNFNDDHVKSIANTNPKLGLAESVRTVHRNDSDVDNCTGDPPVKPSPKGCECRNGKSKSSMSDTVSKGSGRSSSQRSDRTCSKTSMSKETTTKHQSLRQYVSPEIDIAKYSERLPARTRSSNTTSLDTADFSKTCKPHIELAMCTRK